ncbi:hypothetical protein HYH02_003373 [Chlamydomonas schloesseri]|uniref:SET domain-containing protein n=1 Tax=Chlamydomonas schloesseri TaxID=2026947 RepID=A0A836BAT8_9CHLO|nr:hypothetical protein HYH02_003373 [Chlamydomonas schloesseri]|eukprot:KAG2452349.1 hypothetical protein HYH02_003373 [Chlamydomonas schloesseri]
MLEGKGRGVVATRDFKPGDVVMATPPLALVTAHVRQRPDGELVVDSILDRRLYGSKWFSVLYDGSARSCKAGLSYAPQEEAAGAVSSEPDGRPAAPPEPLLASTSAPSKAAAAAAAPKKKGFLASRGAGRKGAGKGAAGAAEAGPAVGGAAEGAELPLPDRREQTRLAKVVKFNCFGDDAEDLAACAARGEEPRGHIGLWPEFAMLNHSCAPNTVNYVVAGSMVVRAVAPIAQGEEVTICYLGRPQLLPFNKRIAILSEDYGFECNCARCLAEQAHVDKLDDAFLEFHEEVEERLGPAFLEARALGDTAAVEEVAEAVAAGLRKLYNLFRKTLLAPDVRQYYIASLYDAYDLAFSCAAALGRGEDGSALQACLKSMEVVSAGSDLHAILAVRHHDHVLATHGPDSPLTALARSALRRAYVARYGAVSEAVMERLVDLNRKLHVQADAADAEAGATAAEADAGAGAGDVSA